MTGITVMTGTAEEDPETSGDDRKRAETADGASEQGHAYIVWAGRGIGPGLGGKKFHGRCGVNDTDP